LLLLVVVVAVVAGSGGVVVAGDVAAWLRGRRYCCCCVLEYTPVRVCGVHPCHHPPLFYHPGQIVSEMKRVPVTVTIPSFRMEKQYNLNKILTEFGMVRVWLLWECGKENAKRKRARECELLVD
jgi:hypothetical protein